MFGISIFGGIFVWILILLTLVAFRAKRQKKGLPPSSLRMPGYPWLAWAGIAALLAILVDSFFINLAIAWYAGIPWLIVISIIYLLYRKKGVSRAERAPL
jgi:L-asparagine transporter-like permease